MLEIVTLDLGKQKARKRNTERSESLRLRALSVRRYVRPNRKFDHLTRNTRNTYARNVTQNARNRYARTRFTWNGRYAIATRLFHHMQKKRQTAEPTIHPSPARRDFVEKNNWFLFFNEITKSTQRSQASTRPTAHDPPISCQT